MVARARPEAAAANAGPAAEAPGNALMGAVRIAVVGLGYWGPNLVRVLHELEEAEVTVACDLDDLVLERLARRFPAISLTRSFEEVIADEDIDAVAIATPVSTHYSLAAAALDAGKHVFVE